MRATLILGLLAGPLLLLPAGCCTLCGPGADSLDGLVKSVDESIRGVLADPDTWSAERVKEWRADLERVRQLAVDAGKSELDTEARKLSERLRSMRAVDWGDDFWRDELEKILTRFSAAAKG